MGVLIISINQTIKNYYSLTKPGVLYGNALTVVAGFLFASKGDIDYLLFLAIFFGSSFVIASACVINNFLDKDIDKLMARTKNRVLVENKVSDAGAVIFSLVLGVMGIIILLAYVNIPVAIIGAVGFVDYVVLYGMFSKRLSWHGTLVGSISGAIPILAGYVAVSGRIDVSAMILFAILFLWQMPEFYSISIYRVKEYRNANVPVISVVKGVLFTRNLILVYTLLFVIASLMLAIIGSLSWVYIIVMTVLGIRWLRIGTDSYKSNDINIWAKQMFKFSLIVLLVFCLLISIDSWLI